MTSKARSVTIAVTVTAEQSDDFAACAEACGLSVAEWLLQCGQVHAAQVRDAKQSEARRDREQTAGNMRSRNFGPGYRKQW